MNWSQGPLAALFLARLRRSPEVGPSETAAISALAAEVRIFDPHTTIVPEGRRGDHVHVMLDGWASRVKILENGSRHIPALFLPGDVCDLDGLLFARSECATTAVTRCTIALFPRERLSSLLDAHRGLRIAFGRMLATELAIATQWTICLGRRSARERLAHLLCELFARLDVAGTPVATGEYACVLPLTQEEIADVLGLTAVHVNRTLQGLRGDGLIQLRDQRLVINDWTGLREASGFDPAYLHLGGAIGARPDTRGVANAPETRLSA